jgi:signal transduction histidine kinase
MSDPTQPTITLTQALETLSRLQSAAPAATAVKLGQVAALLQSMSAENAYLSTLLIDDGISPKTPPQPFARVETVDPSSLATVEVRTVTSMLRDANVENDPTTALLLGVSDALRPPLVAIRGRAELVQGGLLGQITQEQDQWLGAIQENTERAFAVLDTVQELVTLKNGQLKIDLVNFISTELLSEAYERVRDKARVFNHQITIQAPDVVPLAHGDFYQTLIVLTDILDNALRYTPPGGQIRMSVDNLGTHVLFSVADTGIGLSPDDLEKIGRPFWRGDHNRLVRQHTGTGLRLFLGKQILALQEGEMIFSGEPGVGSTFSFTLRTPE